VPVRTRILASTLTLAFTTSALLLVRTYLADLATAPGAPAYQRPLASPSPPPSTAPTASAPTSPASPPRLRVVVLDGLTRADAHGPALDALCARGMDLVVDVGFPTKSLPVQSVLWSGLTAQQSGIAMRNTRRRPIAAALPAQVPDSRAVVEAWTDIARAVGFVVVEPAPDADRARGDAVATATAAWRERFGAAAAAAVATDARLVMVHVLAIDEAGHHHGRDAAYRAEVARGDALLATLLARAPDASWLVISDHGHLVGGGHGDAEPSLRMVRGCVVPRPTAAPARASVHLVDVSRHLHDVLGVAPLPGAVGRPLALAAAAPDPDATLPRVSLAAWLAAVAVLLAGLALTLRRGRPRLAVLAAPLALLAYVALEGAPSLSARSSTMALALGAVAAALVMVPRRDRIHPTRVIALLAPATAATVAAALVSRVPQAALGGEPMRLPHVTAWCQIALILVAPMFLVGGGLVGAVLSGRRTSGSRTPRSGGSDQPVRRPDGPGATVAR
jgi:hypothetical protein